MICEMNIHVQHQHHRCCLIHYLCTHPSMRQRGYASTLMKCAFQENGDLHNNKIYCVTSLPKGYSQKQFYFLKEDLARNDVWKQVSERKTFDAFFDKFAFKRYKKSHCNQSKKIIKKYGKVNNDDLVKEAIKSNKGKRRVSVNYTKND